MGDSCYRRVWRYQRVKKYAFPCFCICISLQGIKSLIQLIHRFIGILNKLRNIHCKNDIKKSLKIAKGGNQNPYIEEQTTQWPKEKVQKDKQRSTKTYT